jgi:aspartyl-tRNA(Asn)/glutamyl-tRNA(Gln) amidotransferase subunit C
VRSSAPCPACPAATSSTSPTSPDHILDQYTKLAELDTDAIPPTAQTIELENILRDDVVVPSLPVDEVLRNAPESADGFIVVPAILGGD